MISPLPPARPRRRVRLRRLLVAGVLGLSVAYGALLAVIVGSQSRIAEVARHTRTHALPDIVAQNDTARDAERLVLFGEEVLNAQDPGARRRARLSAQLMVYDQSFRLDGPSRAQAEQAVATMDTIAKARDRRDALGAEALRALLAAQDRLQGAAPPSGPADQVTGMLVRLTSAPSPAVAQRLADGITQMVADAGLSVPGLAEEAARLHGLRDQMLIIDRETAAQWEATARTLRSLTDTLAVNAEMETAARIGEIEQQTDRATWVAGGMLAGLALLVAGMAVALRRLVVRPLIAATDVLDRASHLDDTGDGVATPLAVAPDTVIAEIASIVEAARRLAENTRALDAERRKVVAMRLEAAAAREHDLRELVAQRTADLEKAMQKAEGANRAKSAFLANMSHELRTPLNAVLGFSRIMMRSREITATDRDTLAIIIRSGEHLLSLINDVLDMSKIEAGRTRLVETGFDLPALVREVGDMLWTRAHDAGLELIVDLDPAVPRYVRSDPVKLRQVLINLIGNAVKYTHEGGIALRVGLPPDAAPVAEGQPAVVVFEIEDTGVGIAEADQARVFDAFEQVASHGEGKGTGLGLAIVRQFVELMGGTVGLRSTPGVGSVFRVDLPVMPVPVAQVAATAPPARRVAGLIPGQRPPRVLIVDDNKDNRLLLRRQLLDVGFEAREARDGEEAVARFQDWRPDLICMDRRMPGMDGLEATRAIRALVGGDDVVIVALTASAFDDQAEDLLAAGCDDFLRKPYRAQELLEMVGRRLHLSYRYDDETEPEATTRRSEDSGLDLSAVSPDLREALGQAVRLRRYGACVEVVARIGAAHPHLGKRLDALVQAFAWQDLDALAA